MDIAYLFTTHIKPFIPVGVAILAYVLGRSAYFRQKEYELITKRYLEEGIDSISKNVDRSLAIFRHNWWQSTVILKHFRDLGKDMRKELYEEGLIAPEPTNFELWRDYRIKDITGDDVFNKAHQALDAFVKSSYAFFKDDLANGIKVTLEGGKELKVTSSRDVIIKGFLEAVVKLDLEAKRYYVLLGELQNISSLIQTKRFSFNNLKTLKEDQVVINGVKILKEVFKDCYEIEGTQAAQDEKRVLMKSYVRGKNSDTWHWCKNCSTYPSVIEYTRKVMPTDGAFCNECKAKDKSNECS